MKLPFFSEATSRPDYYLGLFLKEEEGTVAIITRHRGRVEIKESEKFLYTNGWENLADDVDEVLYRMEKKIGVTVNKTIFFIYSHFIDTALGDIKKPYLTKIKELVRNLELTAMGYIEFIEGAARLLKNKENIPPTAVFLELDKHDFSLFIYKGGKQVQKISLARTDNITDDLETALKNIKGSSLLPSRIILYDGSGLDEAAEKIISFRFEEEYFVQLPRVDILPTEEIKGALVDIFAEQIIPGASEVQAEPEKAPEESFGFVMNEDIRERQVAPLPPKRPFVIPSFKLLTLPALPALPKINLSFLTGKVAAIVGTAIIVMALFLNEYFFHKADIKIYLASEPVNNESNFELDYRVGSESASLSEQTTTTGERQVGDAAKGQVTVYNMSDKEATFEKGTNITANNLKFLFDSQIKVASASSPQPGTLVAGKSSTSVTTSTIGPEGNLGKGTRFAIEELSNNTYFAINEAALAGGTRKTIKTVSADDQNKLESDVLATAKKEVKTPKGITGEIIPNLTETKISQATFTKEVGEEAGEVGIDAEVVTTFYLYDKNKLLTDIQRELQPKVKSGLTLDKSLINYKINKAEVKKDTLSLSLSINAKAIKKISEQEVLKSLKGKNKNNLTILKDKFAVEEYELKINEPIPILSNFLPLFVKNINLVISAR